MIRALLVVLMALFACAARSHDGQPVRIAAIEPLSGAFANGGDANPRAVTLAIEKVNARG